MIAPRHRPWARPPCGVRRAAPASAFSASAFDGGAAGAAATCAEGSRRRIGALAASLLRATASFGVSLPVAAQAMALLPVADAFRRRPPTAGCRRSGRCTCRACAAIPAACAGRVPGCSAPSCSPGARAATCGAARAAGAGARGAGAPPLDEQLPGFWKQRSTSLALCAKADAPASARSARPAASDASQRLP